MMWWEAHPKLAAQVAFDLMEGDSLTRIQAKRGISTSSVKKFKETVVFPNDS